MDDSKADSSASPTGPDSSDRSCAECGSALRAGAEFCTECGASSAPPPEASVGGPAAGECSECGSPLREGAAFCTECGTSSASPTLATGAPPAAAAAAAAALLHEIKTGGSADAAAATTPDAPAPKSGPDKLAAGPAASRTILASVGATGGYSSTRIAGSTRPAPPTTPPTSGMPTRSDDNGKKKILAVLAVVAILITAGIVVVAATSGSDHNSVQASRRSQLDDSKLTSHQTTQTTTAGNSGSSTTVKGHKAKKSSKGGTTTSEAPTTTVKGSKKHRSSSHGSTATTVKGSSPPSTSGGGHSGHPSPPPPPPSSPPTTKGAPPGHLNVGASSIALTGYAPSYHLTLSNSGGSALRWNASISGFGGSVSPSTGQIGGGGVTSITITLNASGTTEGTGGGSLAIVVNSSASGSTTLPVSTDTRLPDTIDYIGWNTASHCTAGSQVHFAVHFRAGAGATPTYSTHVQVDQVGQASSFWVPVSLLLVKNPAPDPRQVWSAQLRHAVSGGLDFTVTATDAAGQVGTGTFHLAC